MRNRISLLVGGLCGGAIVLISSQAPAVPPAARVLRAQEIELVGRNGDTLVHMGESSSEPGTAEIIIGGLAGSIAIDANQDGATIEIKGAKGRVRIDASKKLAAVTASNDKGQVRAMLSVGKDDEGTIASFDKNNGILWRSE